MRQLSAWNGYETLIAVNNATVTDDDDDDNDETADNENDVSDVNEVTTN